MERRDRSLRALQELRYIDSLDLDEKTKRLVVWLEEYVYQGSIKTFDLNNEDLYTLSELFYKNIILYKKHHYQLKSELDNTKKLKKFFS